jgi:hypothetical protein
MPVTTTISGFLIHTNLTMLKNQVFHPKSLLKMALAVSFRELWNRQPANFVCNLTPNDKHVDVKCILLELLNSIEIKNGEMISQFLIAD